MRSLFRWLFSSLVVMVVLVSPVSAEQSKRFGEYVVHYNTLSTDLLDPAVARQYKIKRSKSRAMLNVSVIKQADGGPQHAVPAEVEATSSTLTGHKEILNTREIREGDAIYYISDFPVANRDSLNFVILVKPENTGKTYSIEFRQEFFTD